MNSFFVLVKDNLANSIRNKKAIIFFVLYFAMFLLIASGIFYTQNALDKVLGNQAATHKNPAFIKSIERLTENKEFADYVRRVPFIDIALFGTTIFIMPFLILLLNYDKISQEIYDGTMRYLLFRTSRFKIYLAKFCSEALEVLMITFITIFAALLWGSTKIEHFEVGKTLAYGLQYWLIAQPFLWVFIAFSLIFSGIFKKPFHALLSSMLGFFVLVLLPRWIPFLSPLDSFYTQNLFNDFSLKLISSLGLFTLFTMIYLSSGFYIFNRKDI